MNAEEDEYPTAGKLKDLAAVINENKDPISKVEEYKDLPSDVGVDKDLTFFGY